MDKNTISVIMACYNCASTLSKAIESIVAQTYDNWVMICCDDGSTDNTLEILQAYHDKYPNKIIVIHNETNMRLPYSLNRCLEIVQTDYVARMDADDWSMPDRFEKQIGFLKSHVEYDLVGCGVAVSDGEKIVASIKKIAEPTKYTMLRQNAFSHATIMTYKTVYDKLGGYSLKPHAIRVEDVDLWCRFLAKGFRGYNLCEDLYVILENQDAIKRRNLRARLNSAITRYHGYKLMGFKGLTLIKPFAIVLKAFIPTGIYHTLYYYKRKRKQQMNR